MQKSVESFDIESSETEIVVHNLRLFDQEVISILQECKDEKELEQVLIQAIKVGLLVTRNGQTIENVDYIEKQFNGFNHEMNQNFKLVEQNVADYFGPKGSVTALFDLSNKKGLASKLLEELTKQMQELLNVTSDKTALGMIRRDLQINFSQLTSVVNQMIGKSDEFERGSQKGVKFEEELQEFMLLRTRVTGDQVERTGTTARGRDKKGDLVVTLYEPTIAEALKVVIEAKDTGSIPVDGPHGLLSQVEQGMENRNADFGIGVVKNIDSLPKYNGPFRFYPDKNIIICGFGEDGLPLELAYIFARNLLVEQIGQESETEGIDVDIIESVFNEINSRLKMIRNIKKNMTEIEKITKGTRTELETLDAEIRDLVLEGLNELKQIEEDEEKEELA